ncbi:hypothetical protein NXW84_06425 [Bacteroides fragilis]|nr:hypothetical protein NXW84_06425 [Bacteroides fragilis]
MAQRAAKSTLTDLERGGECFLRQPGLRQGEAESADYSFGRGGGILNA